MRGGTTRFWMTVQLTELSVAVLNRYWRPIWQTWPRIPRIRANLLLPLLVRAVSVVALWLKVCRDLGAALAERSLSLLPDSSGLREGADV